MKLLVNTFVLMLINAIAFAQAPYKMSYQTIIRNSSNSLVTNSTIGMQISILQGSTIGTAVYVEKHIPSTNSNGLASIEIGDGTVISGSFLTINWSNGPYYIKTETDPNGGINYSITGISQLLSVPYAMFAKNAGFTIVNNNSTLTCDISNSGNFYKTFILNIPSSELIMYGKIRVYDINNQLVNIGLLSESYTGFFFDTNPSVIISRVEIPILTINGWKLHIENF